MRYLSDETMSTSTKSEVADPHLLSSSPTDNGQLLVHVSTPLLFLTTVPLLVVVGISFRMNLGLERSVLIGICRSFVQLSILGEILTPIFAWGETCGWLVLAYTALMVLIAAYESMNRSKYRFPGMYLAVLASLGFNVVWVSIFAFCIVLKPQPFWDPQYVIPIVGMLLGNCVNGVALSLNAMLTSLVEQAREIELYMSFGATPREATARLLKESIRVGAVPQLNGMAVIGIISIPGMMTGQILGGSPVREAARYQMLILYLIAVCTFGTIMTETTVALQAGFDHAFRLRTDFFVPRKGGKRRSILHGEWGHFWRFCCCCCYCCFGWPRRSANDREIAIANHHPSEATSLVSDTTKNLIEFHKVRESKGGVGNGEALFRLEVANLSHSFVTAGSDEEDSDKNGEMNQGSSNPRSRRRILFHNLSLELKSGEIALMSGQSGAGKTTLLRLIAGLEPISTFHDNHKNRGHHKGCIRLIVESTANTSTRNHNNLPKTYYPELDPALWRHQVRYVTQYKVDLPGTPKDFIQLISNLQIEHRHDLAGESLEETTMIYEVRKLATCWGVEPSCLETEWATLSGGEAQRVIVAIALASHPRVLLLDEATSAVDLKTKLLVEESIQQYVGMYGISVLWITHDPEQMKRLAS